MAATAAAPLVAHPPPRIANSRILLLGLNINLLFQCSGLIFLRLGHSIDGLHPLGLYFAPTLDNANVTGLLHLSDNKDSLAAVPPLPTA